MCEQLRSVDFEDRRIGDGEVRKPLPFRNRVDELAG